MTALRKVKPPRYYTPEEYFDIDERSEQHLEYVNGEIFTMDGELYVEGKIVAMAGTSIEHNDIALNICVKIKPQFQGRPCKVQMESIRVGVLDGQYRYPDVVAFCGEAQFGPSNPPTLLNPMVIFEVLSPSARSKDEGEKLDEYMQNGTLTDYVLVTPNAMRVRHYHCLSENKWQVSVYTKPEDKVLLESLDVSLTLADIYNEIVFPPPLTIVATQSKRRAVRKTL